MELSGPRPFRRGVDIASKPRILDRGATTVSLESRPIFHITGAGRTAIQLTSTLPCTGVASTLECSVSSAHASKSRLIAPFYDGYDNTWRYGCFYGVVPARIRAFE